LLLDHPAFISLILSYQPLSFLCTWGSFTSHLSAPWIEEILPRKHHHQLGELYNQAVFSY
jgi:hypothetical protein